MYYQFDTLPTDGRYYSEFRMSAHATGLPGETVRYVGPFATAEEARATNPDIPVVRAPLAAELPEPE